MATIPPVNLGALKVTFPANLPRNEKDLICMLLAGRLKDLWNGKLICAQLALDDLIKDLAGFTTGPLAQLKGALVGLNGALGSFKQASGYDTILSNVNKALGQVSNVFSLGGLCPSPVQSPKIPDILSTLNANLFGQANNILAALAQASNPKVCFGGGPKGFGIDWTQVNGSLRNLKDAIGEFKRNPAGFNSAITAFKNNLDNQAARFKAEVQRLEKDLTDPLGINEKKNTVSNITRTKEISDDFTVKDKYGIEYKGPAALLTTGEINLILSRKDDLFTTPVRYETIPILDYCGNIVGYEKKSVTGDPEYLGWDTTDITANTNTPTKIPEATIKDYDYSFVEENNTVNVYDRDGFKVMGISLERGKHYQIGFKLTTRSIQFYKTDNTVWFSGIKVLKEPDYGIGLESVIPEYDAGNTFRMGRTTVEIDWGVQIENPTTPDRLIWKTEDNIQGDITITGIKVLADEDKTYDVGMVAKKSWMFIKHTEQTLHTGKKVTFEETYKLRKYIMDLDIYTESGAIYAETNKAIPWRNSSYNFNSTTNVHSVTIPWGDVNGYTVVKDIETLDSVGDPIPNNWIIIFWQQILEDDTEAAYFRVTDNAGGDNFIIKLTDPAKIQKARNQLSGLEPIKHITGLIVKKTASYNPDYDYHYNPDSIDFFDVAMEVCDATFEYTQEHLDEAGGAFLPGLRLCPWSSQLVEEITFVAPVKKLVIKKYVNDLSGFQVNQLLAYVTEDPADVNAPYELIASLRFDEPVTFLNDIKLPYTDFVDYKLTMPHNGKLNNNEEFKVEKVGNLIRLHLSSNRENTTIPVNEYVYTSDLEFDASDVTRSFLSTNPNTNREVRTYMYFKGLNGFMAEIKLRLEGYTP